MNITRIDHLVLTVKDIRRTVSFYVTVLGMREVTFGSGRTALAFGDHKINLHQQSKEVEPKAFVPMPGSADFCLVSGLPVDQVVEHLSKVGVLIEEGPVARTGALGPIRSVYIRDPDNNLIEISDYGSLPCHRDGDNSGS